MDKGSVINLRMNRLGYTEPAIDGKSYEAVFRRLQPVPTDYFCEPGSPPNLRDRALFDDLSYNRELRRNQRIIKARFQGGTIAYVFDDELELYAAAFAKPFFRPDDAETGLYHVLDRLGPMDKRQIMEELDMKGPEVTKILRKFQMAFKVYEI
ncbi:MAG: hypothetical protein JXB33_06190, partial [Clostridia bacterium]|nr:hypothetical protein [Clostridia bacterium]